MKYLLIFISAFVVVSFLPFLWNHFSFAEAGFPFPYMQKTLIVGLSGTGTKVSFILLNFVYDFVIVAILVWIYKAFK